MKMIVIIISVLVVLFTILIIVGVLKSSHDIRFADGYDSELENDYQAMIAHAKRKRGK